MTKRQKLTVVMRRHICLLSRSVVYRSVVTNEHMVVLADLVLHGIEVELSDLIIFLFPRILYLPIRHLCLRLALLSQAMLVHPGIE